MGCVTMSEIASRAQLRADMLRWALVLVPALGVLRAFRLRLLQRVLLGWGQVRVWALVLGAVQLPVLPGQQAP